MVGSGAGDVIFDLKTALESKNIEFIMARVDQINPEEKVSITPRDFNYYLLVIGTGPKFGNDYRIYIMTAT